MGKFFSPPDYAGGFVVCFSDVRTLSSAGECKRALVSGIERSEKEKIGF